MSIRLRHITYSASAALLIVLFVYTAINKFSAHARFESILHQSPLLKNVSGIMSWLIPVTEMVIAFLLFLPASRQIGLFLSFLLMSLFTIYITYMIYFTPHLPCSCGGVLTALSWREHLVFNIFFTALAAAGYMLGKRSQRIIAINRSS